MFTFLFYVGGTFLIGAVSCCILSIGFRSAPKWARGLTGKAVFTVVCMTIMTALPLAGWFHATRTKEITRRNNEFAAIETELMKLDFNMECTFNGHLTNPETAVSNSFPCIQKENVRVVSNPYRNGLSYFIIDKGVIPVRFRGMLDYPIPFSFPDHPNLMSPDLVKAIFLSEDVVPETAPSEGE